MKQTIFCKTLLVILAVVFCVPQLVFAELVAGQIKDIQFLDNGNATLILKNEGSEIKLQVSGSTLVKKEIPANKIKKGSDIILPKGFGGMKGLKGLTGIKGNKSLGIPSIPNIPNIPDIPEVPKVPEVPGGTSTSAGPQTQPMQNSKEGENLKPPQDPGYQTLNPEAISPATEEDTEASIKKVLDLKIAGDSIELKLQGAEAEENVKLTADQNVFQVLALKDLKKNMHVNLEVRELEQGTIVQAITIQ